MCLSSRNLHNAEEAENILNQYGINLKEYLELSNDAFPEFTCTLETSNEN
ncbi:MAG: hypothetical protein ACRC7N_10075 [Clostridium sp.]